jgi:tight adherence protein C
MLPLLVGAGAITAAVALLCSALLSGRRAPAAARNLTTGMVVSADLRDAVLARSASDRAVRPAVAWLGGRARALTPVGRIDALERRIVLSGTTGWSLERVLAAKVVLGAVGLVLFGLRFLGKPSPLLLLVWIAATGFLFMLPDILLTNAAQKRQDVVRRTLPDVLDQLAITVEAGLAFEAAMARASGNTRGPLGDEMARTLQDVQAGMSRREALRGLSDRVDVPELRSFVTAVVQAEQYGVPIGQVLRVQGAEQRLKRSQRAEEQATKLPVKLLFPTVLFIFPVLFIVLLGPAVLQIGRIF